jgi:hypothetical protein
MFQKDQFMGEMIDRILQKYPQHKRVLFLKAKFDNNEPLSPSEAADLQRLSDLLDRNK